VETKYCKHCKISHPITEEYWLKDGVCRFHNKRRCLQKYQNNKQTYLDKLAKKYQDNPELFRSRGRQRYWAHSEKHKERTRHWKKQNLGLVRAWGAKHRADKLQATPTWLSKDQLKWIAWHYKHAAKMEEVTGIKHHVDHIHPLKGKKAAGLHVPWNLQVIPAAENLRKSNRMAQEKT
jgi:hypothetical protein